MSSVLKCPPCTVGRRKEGTGRPTSRLGEDAGSSAGAVAQARVKTPAHATIHRTAVVSPRFKARPAYPTRGAPRSSASPSVSAAQLPPAHLDADTGDVAHVELAATGPRRCLPRSLRRREAED